MRRRRESNDGLVIKILLVASFIVGLLMMTLGIVFRVYVCHWVAKVLFAIWIGVFVMFAAGIGICTRVSQDYGPRHGPTCVLAMSLVNFVLCFIMVGCLAFSMSDFNRDKWYRVPKPYLVVDPDHCVVERHVNYYYYYETIKQHGRDGLKYGSILIGVGLLEMMLTLLRCLFIGRLKEYYGKTEIIKKQQQQQPPPRGNAQV